MILSRRLAADGLDAFRVAKQRGYEGLVAKCLTSTYVEGRSREWLKVKVHQEDEWVRSLSFRLSKVTREPCLYAKIRIPSYFSSVSPVRITKWSPTSVASIGRTRNGIVSFTWNSDAEERRCVLGIIHRAQ